MNPKVLPLLILALGVGFPVSAEEAGSGGFQSDGVAVSSAGEPTEEDVSSNGGLPEADASGDELGYTHWLDRYREFFRARLNDSANWVDGVLAAEGMENEPENVYGRVSANLYWQNRSGFELRTRFRVRVSLDATNRRFNAIIGRGDPSDFIDDRYDSSARFASFYRGDDSDRFLAGLAVQPDWVGSGSFSVGGGVSFSDGINPYVNINYRYRHISKDEKWMVGAFQTFYFQTGKVGFGSRTTFEPEYLINDNWLIRNFTLFEVNEVILGLRCETTFTLYQDLGRSRAIAYEAGVYTETGREIPFVNYGFTVTYRQRMFRDWLFGEVTVGLSFPRGFAAWERRGDPLIGFGMEVFFGD